MFQANERKSTIEYNGHVFITQVNLIMDFIE